MPRLDSLLEKLFSNPNAQLVLETGAGASLVTATGSLPLIRQPLTTQQIVSALAEIVPADLQRTFPRPGKTSFTYSAPRGTVEVHLESLEGKGRAGAAACDRARPGPDL